MALWNRGRGNLRATIPYAPSIPDPAGGKAFCSTVGCGTPVVAFRVGGIPDVVRDGETGYLAGYKDATDLARGIDLLLTDGALRERLGRHGREVVEAEYSMDLQARRFEKLYQDILRE